MMRIATFLFLAAAVAAAGPPAGASEVDTGESLAGKLLVAVPSMPDPRFRESVIYMCNHDRRGALGLVVNRRMASVPAPAVTEQFRLEAEPNDHELPVHWGGPVDPGRLFVLHSSDYESESTEFVSPGVAFSVDSGILVDLVEARGPDRAILVLGYSGWSGGQLESELRRDDWLVVPADPALVFADDLGAVWRAALDLAEIDL